MFVLAALPGHEVRVGCHNRHAQFLVTAGQNALRVHGLFDVERRRLGLGLEHKAARDLGAEKT